MNDTVINIALELKRPGLRTAKELKCDIRGLEFMGRGLVPTEPISIELVCNYDGESLAAEGKLKALFVENCALCGKEFVLTFEHSFSERFVQESGRHTDAADLDGVYTFSGEFIDLFELIRDIILLHMPMNSVCSDTCRGLCPFCGADHNAEPCSCGEENAIEAEKPDNPLAELLSKLYDENKEV